MNELKDTFQCMGFSETDAQKIASSFSLKHYNSGDLFVRENMVSDYLGYVGVGMFQFYYDHDGDEITTYIALKNDFILSVQSFFTGQPAKENIKALVSSDVWVISISDFEILKNNIKGFKDFYINVLEHLMVCIDQSRFDFITLKPEERYIKLLKNEPILLQQIPLKYLASLIGVTPRHLSRIRNSIQ